MRAYFCTYNLFLIRALRVVVIRGLYGIVYGLHHSEAEVRHDLRRIVYGYGCDDVFKASPKKNLVKKNRRLAPLSVGKWMHGAAAAVCVAVAPTHPNLWCSYTYVRYVL